MHFESSSRNDDFIFNGTKLPYCWEAKILGLMRNIELKFEPYIRSAEADIVFLKP